MLIIARIWAGAEPKGAGAVPSMGQAQPHPHCSLSLSLPKGSSEEQGETKKSKFQGDEREIKATFSAAALAGTHLSLSSWDTSEHPSLCCTAWNSNYSGYHFKKTPVPVTFCAR